MKFLTSEITRVSVDELKTHPENPRKGNVDAIAESLAIHGQFAPIVVQRSTGYILAGNHTYLAAVKNKWEQIDAVYVDVDDAQARRIILVANRTADLGTYDDGILADLLSRLQHEDELGLSGTGYAEGDLDKLLESLGDGLDIKETLPEAGDAPEDELGEVWGVIITADDEEHQVELLERFAAEGLKVRAMMV